MAKKSSKTTDDDRDEREEREREERDRDEREEREEEIPPPPEQIAVDYGDGTYQIIDAPEGSGPRSILVLIDGKHYQHVDEHEGLWAYRNLDPPQDPPEKPEPPEPEVKV